MGRRTVVGLLLALVLAGTAACGGNDCVKVRGPGEIKVQVPGAIQKLVGTLRLELCQGAHCGSVNLAAATDGAYTVGLDRLGSGWKPATASGLTLIGTTKAGRVVVRHTEQFTFDAYVPTAEDCDQTPTLTHVTGVSGSDLGD